MRGTLASMETALKMHGRMISMYPFYRYFNTPTWRAYSRALRTFYEDTVHFMGEAKKRSSESAFDATSLLEHLETVKALPHIEIVQNLIFVFFSGMDTTSITLICRGCRVRGAGWSFVPTVEFLQKSTSKILQRTRSLQTGTLVEEEQGGTVHDFASLPFGFGPRICPRKHISESEMYVLMTRLLQKFEVVPTSNLRNIDMVYHWFLFSAKNLRFNSGKGNELERRFEYKTSVVPE